MGGVNLAVGSEFDEIVVVVVVVIVVVLINAVTVVEVVVVVVLIIGLAEIKTGLETLES